MGTTSVLASQLLDKAKTEGRIRDFWYVGYRWTIVPLSGRPVKAATLTAVERTLDSLGAGRGNIGKK
jgi:hypothetical protein